MNMLNYLVSKINVGFMPHGIGLDESKNLLYVASRNILANGPAPHHTGVCSGRNGYINYVNTQTLLLDKKRTEISIDPFSIGVRK